MSGSIRVGIVDDHPAILAALGAAVDAAEDMILSGTGRTLADALQLASGADVVVCDVQLAGHAEGLLLLDAVAAQQRRAAVLLVSGHGHPSVVRAAFERGAAGYLDKSAEVGSMIDAIRTIAAGGTAFRASDLAAVRSSPVRPSERELQVIDAVVAGRTNAEIGAHLGVSEKTVESHLHRLFDRYGLLSRTELAVLALHERWVPQPVGGDG